MIEGDDRVLRRTLRVAAVRDGQVELEADRLSACRTCAVKAGCGTGALAEMIEGRTLRISVARPDHISPGDDVTVALPAGAFLGAAGLAYLLPPFALVVAVMVCAGLGLTDRATFAIGLGALALSFWPLRRVDRAGRLMAAMQIEAVHPADRVS